jgi:hypothetical protein
MPSDRRLTAPEVRAATVIHYDVRALSLLRELTVSEYKLEDQSSFFGLVVLQLLLVTWVSLFVVTRYLDFSGT